MLVDTPPKLIPAILAKTKVELEQKIGFLKDHFDRLQIDVVDDSFGSPSVGPEVLTNPSFGQFEVHQMVKNPLDYLARYQPDFVIRVVAQLEPLAKKDQFDFCLQAIEKGFRVGLALDLPTELERLAPEVLDLVDQLLILGVKAGRAGQVFDANALAKIRQLKEIKRKRGYDFAIGVDGGVEPSVVRSLLAAGAEELCVGSFLLTSQNLDQSVAALQKAIKESNGD